MAVRKTTRKKAAKKTAKKSAKKKATRKKAAKKKATRKKGAKRKSTRKRAVKRTAADLIGSELPKSLKAFGRQLRRDLLSIEKQIEIAGKDTRRSLARIVRDVSHQLGTLEARGEREWRALSRNAKKDVEKVMKKARKAAGA